MDRRFRRVLHLVRAIVCWGPGAVDDVMRNDRRRREVWSPRAPGAVILIRLLVGLVFFEEGLQKFLFPAVMGAGRFVRIGIPAPAVIGPFVGVVEIVCGAMLALGLLTRLAAVPLLVDITVAILSTKLPILLGHGYVARVAMRRQPTHAPRPSDCAEGCRYVRRPGSPSAARVVQPEHASIAGGRRGRGGAVGCMFSPTRVASSLPDGGTSTGGDPTPILAAFDFGSEGAQPGAGKSDQ
jgi:DoxX